MTSYRISAKGRKMFVALFGSQKIISTDLKGTKQSDFVTGFVAPVLSTAVHKGFVYAGDFTGRIYRVKG